MLPVVVGASLLHRVSRFSLRDAYTLLNRNGRKDDAMSSVDAVFDFDQFERAVVFGYAASED